MKNRLLALDIFRGITIAFMILVNTPGSWSHVYAPLLHAKWDGCTPTDLVFPFFIFIVGVSMSYSFNKYQNTERSQWISKILKRTALIFLIGLVLNWFPFYNKSIGDLRIFGVLQRIALAYGGAALLLVFLKDKTWLRAAFVIILLGYWAILMFFGGEDPLSLANNLVRSIDLKLFGENHLYGGYGMPFDPEGLLSALPAIGTALLGYFVGKEIQSDPDISKTIPRIVIAGFILISIATAWHYLGFPINKPIWSSSYVLFSGGIATAFLGLLLWIIDVKGWKKWSFPFRAFGLNSLVSYVLSGLFVKISFLIKIDGANLYSWIYKNVFSALFGNLNGSFLFAITYVMFIWFFAWLLYRKGKIIKI